MKVSKITSNKVLNLPMVGGAVPSISEGDKEVFAAFSSKKISSMSTNEVGAILNNAISRAYYHAGHAIPDFKELLSLQVYLADFLKSETIYQNIHIDEVSIALKRGSDKHYGEFFGINPATITGWIKAHVESESRKAAKLMQQTIMLSKPDKPTPTDEELTRDFIQRLEMLYIFHQTGKEILRTEGSYFFEKLYSSKVIRLSESDRNRLKKTAFERLTASKNPKVSKTKDQYDKMKIIYEKFLSAGIEGDEVRREAMYIGLLEWFDFMKAFDKEIRDEIINQ